MNLLRALQNRVLPPGKSEPPTIKFTDSFLSTLVITQDNIAEKDYIRDRKGYIHVTDLLRFCARRQVLCVRDKIQQLKVPRCADRVLWEMGKAAERHVRTQIIKAMNYRNIVGNWGCFCGGLEYGGFFVADRVCARCNSPAIIYHEFTLADDDARIIGHPDLMFYYDNAMLVVEIKSMNKDDFKALSEPSPNHIFQGGSYRRLLLQRQTVPVHREIAVLYVCKDYIFKGVPYKEYYPEPTKGQWPNVLDIAWKHAYDVKHALAEGIIPPRIEACPSSESTTAKNCVACTNCFARKK